MPCAVDAPRPLPSDTHHDEELVELGAAQDLQETAGALRSRGVALGCLGRPADAIRDFDRFLSIDPDNPEALTARGLAYCQPGRRYPQKVCKQSGGVISLNKTGSRPKRGDTLPMSKESIGSRSESRPEWEHLEDWVRGQVQRLIQDLLEQEVTEFLGRARSVRRSDSDSDTGYRNGYAPPRKLTLSSGTIHLRRPRVRDTEERFESRLLPLFVHRTRKVADLIPEL